MKKTISVAMCILAMAAGMPSQAEEHLAKKNEKPIHLMFNGDTVNVKKAFKENAPSAYNIPGMPRFAIFGKEGKFYLGVGGTVKGVLGYDLGNPVNNPNDFIVSSIPMRREKGDGGKFFASAGESSIFLNVVALPGSTNQLSAYVMFNFSGNNYAPSLQDAYIRYRGFKVGYASSLFTDEAAISPTIDSQGPNAFTSVTNTVLDYELSFGKKKEWKFGVGLELPQLSLTNTTATRKVNQRVPDIPAYIQYSWMNGSGKIRLSGLIRNLYYRDIPGDRNIDNVGWGIQLSGYTPIVGGLSAYYQAVYGEGINNYIQDLNGLGMDLMPVGIQSRTLKPVKSWGGYLGLQYQFTPDVFATCTYSHVRTYARPYVNSAEPWSEQYKYGQYVVANVFWNITSYLQTGVEYIYGRRVDYNNAKAHDNRLQTMIQLSF